MHVHLVFVTKYRSRVFDGDSINRLRILFTSICTDFEAELVQMDGGDNHVHLLVKYPPKVAVSNLVRSPSYFAASCGGAPINILKDYIQQQKTRFNGLVSTP